MAEFLYFGKLSDVTGTLEEQLDLPAGVGDTAALREWMDAKKDAGGALTSTTVRLCINDVLVAEPQAVTNGDRIAFLPPVGGG